jgi:hypothetical protein
VKDSTLFGPTISVGQIQVPANYDKREAMSRFVSDWYTHADTFYFGNFLADYENFAPTTEPLVPGSSYEALLVPIATSAPGSVVYCTLSERGYSRIGVPGLFLLQAQLPHAFPAGKYVTLVDSEWILPLDRSGNRRTARIRYFWSPVANQYLWEFGAGFLEESLQAGNYAVGFVPA